MLRNFGLLVVFTGLLVSQGAHAILLSRLDGIAVYDTDRHITWLADANFYRHSWDNVQDKIAELNATSLLGFDNWRLPVAPLYDLSCTGIDGPHGFNCTAGELGHLFYEELGGEAGTPILSVHNLQFELFSSVQSNYYWYGTLSPIYPGPLAFRFQDGAQDASNNFASEYFVWLVRDGDVSAVPEPSGAWLVIIGVGVLVRIRGGKDIRIGPSPSE